MNQIIKQFLHTSLLSLMFLSSGIAMDSPEVGESSFAKVYSDYTKYCEEQDLQRKNPLERSKIAIDLSVLLADGKIVPESKPKALEIAKGVGAYNLEIRINQWTQDLDFGMTLLQEIWPIIFKYNDFLDLIRFMLINKSFHYAFLKLPVTVDSSLLKKSITNDILGNITSLFPKMKTLILDSSDISAAGVELLSSLNNIECLYFIGCHFGNDGLVPVKNLTNLRMLSLFHLSEITDTGLEPLQNLTNLTALSLQCSQLTDVGVSHLEKLVNLTDIDLDNANMSDTGLGLILNLPKLEHLSMGGTSVTDEGLVHLKGKTKLQSICFENTSISDQGMMHFGDLLHLEMINMMGSAITHEGMAYLKNLPNYTAFSMGSYGPEPELTDKELGYISTMTNLTELELIGYLPYIETLNCLSSLRKLTMFNLWLKHTEMSKNCLDCIKSMITIQEFSLESENIRDEDLAPLGYLTNLIELTLDAPKVTISGLGTFIHKLSNLKELNLTINLSDDDAPELRKLLPNTQVEIFSNLSDHENEGLDDQ